MISSSRVFGPTVRLQELALPASSLALTPRNWFHLSAGGQQPQGLVTLILPTSEPALAPGPPWVKPHPTSPGGHPSPMRHNIKAHAALLGGTLEHIAWVRRGIHC